MYRHGTSHLKSSHEILLEFLSILLKDLNDRALCLPVTAARHHQFPMPPCHCCKASSVPYAFLSLLQGLISALCLPVARHTAASSPPSLHSLRALCYYSLYTAPCWSVFYTHDGLVWSVFYTPTVWSGLVWSGLCFIPNRDNAGNFLANDRGNARNLAESHGKFHRGNYYALATVMIMCRLISTMYNRTLSPECSGTSELSAPPHFSSHLPQHLISPSLLLEIFIMSHSPFPPSPGASNTSPPLPPGVRLLVPRL